MADAVVLILYDEKKNILFQKRDKHALKHPNQWSFFGGAMESNETPKEAVQREALEELNFTSKQYMLATVTEIKNDGTKFYFLAKCADKNMLHLREGKAMLWISLEEAKKLSLVP